MGPFVEGLLGSLPVTLVFGAGLLCMGLFIGLGGLILVASCCPAAAVRLTGLVKTADCGLCCLGLSGNTADPGCGILEGLCVLIGAGFGVVEGFAPCGTAALTLLLCGGFGV